MLSIFPIQFLAPVAYLLLRLCIGLMFIQLARRSLAHILLKKKNAVPPSTIHRIRIWSTFFVKLGAGILLILGLFTQIGALTVIAYTSFNLRTNARGPSLHGLSRPTLVCMLCIALSLFITGPGILAFDLPL